MLDFLHDKVLLVTGGTGSFGRRFSRAVLTRSRLRKLVVLSRDELKQSEMREALPDPRLRFFLGDVRDRDRVYRAFAGVDFVVHAAALKQIPAAEYNPFECVKTNILGAQNVIDAAIDQGVDRVVALSTDKASSPVNLYGATKLVSDKLFVAGNVYSGDRPTRFAVVRYGNVIGSRGSVIPLFRKQAIEGRITITDLGMTRFWITLDHGIELVLEALQHSRGGEIFVPKIPSMRLIDLAKAVAPDAEIEIVGVRPGEKLHEEMISANDARRTVECDDHYLILPDIPVPGQSRFRVGSPVPSGFEYTSDNNEEWLDVETLRGWING